ncbi:amino acid permease [Phenylobacterium sp. J426]|uniref:amino acid permease n=1 Tax=Phenylobacterium sp. J426 TaxID=2898439 RepID=UPI0021516742|nr:amino acid permease [Phenylobacterium sp. J426]MCR5874151.1 amino acid permease [Phenylobacterium sp. J426]
MSFITRRKPLGASQMSEGGDALRRTLSWPHLVALGVGAIVGTGILTLTGVGAGLAGPGVILSFMLAGAVCACAALAYAEMATMMPAAGSAYTYSYTVLGEFLAWIVGWSLILEYTVVCSAVAVGWSAYAVGFLQNQAGLELPQALIAGPHAGGLVNLPAVFIALAVAGLLLAGTRESANVNFALVVLKLLALAVFIVVAGMAFNGQNFHPFMPNGFLPTTNADGTRVGVAAAAAIIFFAFYGFDAISTAAEEAKNPGRDLTIGIVGSMLACTVIYMLVAGAALGAMPAAELAKSEEPLALVLRTLGQPLAAGMMAVVAFLALPTVIMAFMFGQSRIFFAMSRDGLLPRGLAKVSSRGVPVFVTIFTGVVAAVIAGAFPLGEIAALANAGTLVAFIATAACMMILRRREPNAPRPFRTPLWPLVGVLAIVGCVWLFTSLPLSTMRNFLIWNAAGVVVYLVYARTRSRLALQG